MRISLFIAITALFLTACGAKTADGKTVYFQDDFSDAESGWSRASDADGLTDYEQDGYRIFVDTANMSFMSTIEHGEQTDVSIEADARKVGGSDVNEFGLICRYGLLDTFYAGVVTSDGYYALLEKDLITEEIQILGSGEFVRTDLVNTGSATNHLRLDCVGTTISFYINGELAEEVTDETQTDGYSGFYVGTYEDGGTDVVFDNFVVHAP